MKSHDNGFDAVRLSAACMVLYSHQFALWGQPEPSLLGMSLGAFGVAVFFVLSGYLVTHSFVADPHVGRFLARRLLRLLPALWVNVLVCILGLGLLFSTLPAWEYLTHEKTHEYLLNGLFQPLFHLPGVFGTEPINGSLWTLPFELLAYLLLALVGAFLGGQGWRWFTPLGFALVLALALRWQPGFEVLSWGSNLTKAPLFLSYFMLGALLAAGAQRWLTAHSLLAMALAALLLPEGSLKAVLSVIAVLGAVLLFGLRPWPPRWALRHDLSYGVYLYAFPIQQVLAQQMPELGLWPAMGLALLLTLLCAWCSWRWVEAPMLRLKPRRRTVADRSQAQNSPVELSLRSSL